MREVRAIVGIHFVMKLDVFYHIGDFKGSRILLVCPLSIGTSSEFSRASKFNFGRSGSIHTSRAVGDSDEDVFWCNRSFGFLDLCRAMMVTFLSVS